MFRLEPEEAVHLGAVLRETLVLGVYFGRPLCRHPRWAPVLAAPLGLWFVLRDPPLELPICESCVKSEATKGLKRREWDGIVEGLDQGLVKIVRLLPG